MMNPCVSIIIPTFNSAGTIEEALASVRAQTFTDYEVIVVDDASTDNTVDIARAQLQTPSRSAANARTDESPPVLHRFSEGGHHPIIVLPENRGPAAARNAGIAAAKGEWIAFLDGDDAWLPWRLELQVRMTSRYNDIELLCGGVAEMYPEVPASEMVFEQLGVKRLMLNDFAIRNEVATSTVLARKRALEDAGLFDVQFRGPEDYDLWMRVAAIFPVLKIDYPLSQYRHVEGSLSRDDRKFLPAVLRVLDKAYSEGGVLHDISGKKRAKAYQYLCAAWMAAERGAHATAFRLFFTSFLHWPLSFEPYLRLPWCRTKLLVGLMRAMTVEH